MPLSTSCPGCREPLDVDDEYRTWKVRCPRCGAEFVPDDQPAARPIAVASGRRVREPDDDDDDDYDDRPRRRRRRRFGLADYEEAERDVYGPGICLELVGWLGVLATLGLITLFAAAVFGGRPNGPRNDDAVGMFVCGGIMAVVGIPFHLVLAIGGRHLRRLTSRGWAVAAGVAATAMFVLVNVFGVFHAGPGIWALVVADRKHVKAAFDYRAKNGGPPAGDDED